MASRIAKGMILLGSLAPMAILVATPSQSNRPVDVEFDHDVLPIFRAHCSPCHTGDQRSGDLSLNSFESLMMGGVSGSVVQKGLSKSSLLIDRILGKGGLPRMPMGFKPLDERDRKLIEAWIDQGAKAPVVGASKRHWAFVPPVRPPVPLVGAWAKNPIDNFILARLKKEGLAPSPQADKATLIRRVTLDLIGLPPTPTEVDAFVADKSANAYEKVVDRLLVSPHYGERMALPWLDAARYADSNGFQQDGDTYQYVWRDWVVKALNSNMPFNQFTMEQLAGDLLPKPTLDQLVATGFNRNHMLNGEGGAIPEEQRFVNLFDRVDTTATTWLGLTMACARCHDHKYDPLTQVDYYSMMAYFNQVPETGVPSGSGQYRIAEPWVYAGSSSQMLELLTAGKQIEVALSSVESYKDSSDFKIAFENWKAAAREGLKGNEVGHNEWHDVGAFQGTSFDDAFQRDFGPENGRIEVDVIRSDIRDGRTIALSGENTAFYFWRVFEVDRNLDYLFSFGSDDGIRVWVNGKELLSRKVTRGVTPDSDRIITRLNKGANVVLLKVVNGGGVGGFYFRGFVGGIDDKTATELRSEAPNEIALKTTFAEYFAGPKLKELQLAAKRANENLVEVQSSTPRVMIMSDAKPRKTFVLNRGDYENHLGEVQPASPKSLPGASANKNRLGLARWIVSENNPLTARVQVNRAWQLFFGRGLVRTEENFGVKGEPPTHPELLDWLAVDLRENGWNLKRLHKHIVMSATYRQSSKVTPAALKRDPANQFYGRAPRFRLPSPILRDVALVSSGLLNRKIGGKPVYPYQPAGIWDGLSITLERDFTYPQSKGADLHRRSLYTFWRRTAAPGNMFDSSSRQVCTVKPSLTSTPLHALTMMNDVTWVEAGRALARSVLSLPSDDAKLKEAFRRVCARRPSADEVAVLRRSLDRSRKTYQKDANAAIQYLSQGETKLTPSELRMAPDLAALSAVCVAIFNLDEAMTRN